MLPWTIPGGGVLLAHRLRVRRYGLEARTTLGDDDQGDDKASDRVLLGTTRSRYRAVRFMRLPSSLRFRMALAVRMPLKSAPPTPQLQMSCPLR